jgi:nitrogen fixation NifU-like protein
MLYAEKLFQRYKKPLFKGKIMKGNKDEEIRIATEENVVCGDRIKVYVKLEKGKINDAKFEGSGCVISMGSADLLMENIIGKDVKKIKKMKEEDIIKIIGFTPDPARMHCATLALKALRKIL